MTSDPEHLADGVNLGEEWEVFEERLKQAVDSGCLRSKQPLRLIYRDYEEWFVDTTSGDVYVYVGPDDKTFPVWEKVDVFAEPQVEESRDLREAGLGLIPTGSIDQEMFHFLQLVLETRAAEGAVEQVPLPDSANASQTWYREMSTNIVYRLVEDRESMQYQWDVVPNWMKARIT